MSLLGQYCVFILPVIWGGWRDENEGSLGTVERTPEPWLKWKIIPQDYYNLSEPSAMQCGPLMAMVRRITDKGCGMGNSTILWVDDDDQ